MRSVDSDGKATQAGLATTQLDQLHVARMQRWVFSFFLVFCYINHRCMQTEVFHSWVCTVLTFLFKCLSLNRVLFIFISFFQSGSVFECTKVELPFCLFICFFPIRWWLGAWGHDLVGFVLVRLFLLLTFVKRCNVLSDGVQCKFVFRQKICK